MAFGCLVDMLEMGMGMNYVNGHEWKWGRLYALNHYHDYTFSSPCLDIFFCM